MVVRIDFIVLLRHISVQKRTSMRILEQNRGILDEIAEILK